MTSVRFLGPDTDAYVASVERHASEFVERTGIELDVRIVPSDLYFSNRIEHLLDGDDAADVYMSGPVLLWEHLASGFVQPLDDLLERASDAYEAEDFVEPLLRCNRWSGRFGDPLGNGPLLEIPVNCESYNLAYVPDVLERAGVDPPRTWEECGGAPGRAADGRHGARLRAAGHRRLAHDVHGVRDAVLVVRRPRLRRRTLRDRITRIGPSDRGLPRRAP
jgi:multiple sugar transport system substrate-binding protein